MTLNIPGYPPEQFLMEIRSPSSFQYLPRLRTPSTQTIRDVEALQRPIVERSGLEPGDYSSLDRETYKRVEFVYNELLNLLLEEISGLDVADLTLSLYGWLEGMLGHMNKLRYESIPDLLIAGNPRSSNSVHEMWLRVSPFTEAIRWLIEVAIKSCGVSRVRTTDRQLDLIVALSRNILLWDGSWEHIAYEVLPHTLTIKPDFTIESGPQPQGMAAWATYHKAMVPWRDELDRRWMLSVTSKDVEVTRAEARALNREQLDRAIEIELGYNLKDWMNYSLGLIDSFDYHEYIKAMPKEELGQFLQSKRQVSPETFESLLLDHSLSKQTISELQLDQIRPAEHARRDSRLFRRPVVVLEQGDGESICLYGIETVVAWTPRFEGQFLSGRIQLPRMSSTGPVKRAIGAIQRTIGNTFRDEISQRCGAIGIDSVTEKDSAGTEHIPQGAGFGPVDVFAVDRRSRRFVLMEVKDLDDPGIVPRRMRAEMDSFRRHVEKLQKQADWFTTRVEALKCELGISTTDQYTIEGVIVVNHPRPWMYAFQEPMPIVSDKDLIDLLTTGERLVTPLADMKPSVSGRGLYIPDGQEWLN